MKDLALNEFLASLPDTGTPEFDQYRALTLAALPISCIDRPQRPPAGQNYLYPDSNVPQLLEDHEKNRAFYGAYDWHSAVHSIWAMVIILRRFPQIPIAGLLREKLNDHLTTQAIQGELEFFQSAGNFEMPYGRSWLLKLFASLQAWDDPYALRWTRALSPLAEEVATSLLDYVIGLRVANRTGLHGNSAYSFSLMLDCAGVSNASSLRQAIEEEALRLFGADQLCPTAYEPSAADFLSPCLEEARLMSRVLDQDRFISWFDSFMPAPGSDAFRPLVQPFDTSGMTAAGQFSSKSHLIGLSFARAEAMLQIGSKLPDDDPRQGIYRRLAQIHGKHGWDNLFAAGYLGTHWLATFALRYELARCGHEN